MKKQKSLSKKQLALNEHRVERAVQRTRLIIARYAPLAASKLVQLTESENQETARKACLDIISMISPDNRNPQAGLGAKCSDSDASPQLSDEAVSILLAALAKAPEPA